MRFHPCFSHGGPSEPGWAAVAGTTTNSGRPIDIGGADANPANWPVLEIFCAGGTATVLIEANGGDVDPNTGVPPSGEWIDISGGGYAMTAATNVAKRIPPNVPYIRTRISVINGATVTSYVPAICYPGGKWSSATHPHVSSSSVS